jgi:lysine/ornithine N-monooxygenase
VIASYVIGLATMRHGLGSPALSGSAQRRAAVLAAAAIQACVG